MNRRLTILKTILWAFVGGLAMLTVARFWHGLGATTNLSDAAPWGLWIALDVMAGVALAAGGFVLAGTVYVFGRERYRPLVRPAILTAFLGYVAVAVGLFYDLGLPWHIWHPMVYWQHHSVLFEVAMCVITYLAVLALEFSPVVLEHPMFGHPMFRGILKVLKRATIPLVIAGIVLSTLHQSSLGSLFLITPHRLHPLWYSPIIYVLFFVSAVALGMMMVSFESLFSAFFYGHKVRKDLLANLGKAAAVVLTMYVVLRVGDLIVRGVLPSALDGSWQSVLFISELLVCAVIPVALLLKRRVRNSVAGLAVCSILTVLGMVWNRLNVAIVAINRPAGMSYFPSWMELLVSLGVISAATLSFLYLVEQLKVYEERARTFPRKPSYDPASLHALAPYALSTPRRFSLAFVIAATLVAYFLPRDAVLGVRPTRTPVDAVRAVDGLLREDREGTTKRLDILTAGVDTPEVTKRKRLFMIDGNRDGNTVLFDHAAHIKRISIPGRDSCGTCHHLNMPLDRNSSCSECHRDMYEPTDIFSHSSHVRKLNGNDGCTRCHSDNSAAKTRDTATACSECHTEEVAQGAFVTSPGARWREAPGYMDAMHALCVTCHQKTIENTPERAPTNLARCDACHNVDHVARLREMIPSHKKMTPSDTFPSRNPISQAGRNKQP
ncbi:MAG: Ni/Fe-hydrogenase cytochrome b subunit [Candidatus Latescibacterota bacterium]|nr:MAG: Ni/Fe-hydrogenase cytochrome b subunit [Candidatus Latescibacterota bacterium]